MKKVIDLNKNVAQLCKLYPELKRIMAKLGFKDILKPLALNSMGRIMTIPKGAAIKEISLSKIIDALIDNGFEVINIPETIDLVSEQNELDHNDDTSIIMNVSHQAQNQTLSDKEHLLKSYIHRLTEGEDLEIVKEEFKLNFSDVSAVEIARAEQSLMREGTPLEDVQKLCDVHSALFHGKTQAERIAEAEKEVKRSAKEEELNKVTSGFDADISKQTAKFMKETGHPLHVLSLENHEIIILLDEISRLREDGQKVEQLEKQIKKLMTIAQHYGKKDELLFPLLKDKYNYPGPSDVMWGVEDEIRDSLRQLLNHEDGLEAEKAFSAVLKRIQEMIYKEENILFPLCTSLFTEEEWFAVARDMPMFGPCMIEDIPEWEKASKIKSSSWTEQNKVNLPGGSFSTTQLRSMLNTIPMELTLIDEKDRNCFFNEGEKLFTRPMMAIGRPVYSCHPKRVEPMVRLLIHEFKTGKKDSMHIMSEKCGKTVIINYYALRGEDGAYLGTMEAVQELDQIKDALAKGKKGPIKL